LIASIYLLCFFTSIFLSLALTQWVRSYATSHGWVSKPELDRHIHTKSVPRIGGVAIFVSFMVMAGLSMLIPRWLGLHIASPSYKALLSILGAAFVIFLLGFYDDLRGLGPYWKFAIQAVAAVILYAGGVGVQQLDLFSAGHSLRTIIGLPLSVIWILLITNAFNLIDGLDGLAAGSAFFSTLILFVTSLSVSNSMVALLTIALAGTILGFLRFNFHPASIFLGDSGSMFIGFMLAALALEGSQKAPTMIAVAIPVISSGFPILDVALAVSRRFLGGKPLFSGDSDHIHHKLLKRGLSQRRVVLVLYGVTSIFALLSLVILHDAAKIAVVLTIIGVGVAFGVEYLGYAEFSEVKDLLRRTAARKRFIANNVEVRHAIEALNSCADINAVCKILKNSLQLIGFDGFRIGHSLADVFSDTAAVPFELTDGGELQSFWNNVQKNESTLELRFELITDIHRRLGYFSLLRVATGNPLLVDFNLLSCEFRLALSRAVLRSTNGGEGHAARVVYQGSEKNLRTKAVSSASD
jgi:UDP-GlcNAc:undecaprenyl-phosphate GlcNAc-1-phosphate transferase